MIITAVTNNLRPTAFKTVRLSCVLVDVNQRRAVEIILNADKISRQRSQEVENLALLKEGKTLFKLIF